MPICPRCSIAYLDGEQHRCEASPSLWPVAAGITLGAVLGATAGAVAITVVVYLAGITRAAGALIYFVGPPVGAVIGIVAGIRAASRAQAGDPWR